MVEEARLWNEQYIEYIELGDLVLWSENPRDPLDCQADNKEIIARALRDDTEDPRWELDKLAKSMGDEYDFSELPTVVKMQDGKYCVYDGNRRVILAMLAAAGISPVSPQMSLPMFPSAIPCCVCPRDKALRHVLRKHGESSSWKAYERDLFSYKYLDGKKTVLIRIEELVGGITRYPRLNQRYVRDDVLNDKHLREIGLDIDEENYGVSCATLLEFLDVIDREVSLGGALRTRGRRNDPLSVLPSGLLEKIRQERIGFVGKGEKGKDAHPQYDGGCEAGFTWVSGGRTDGGLGSEEATLAPPGRKTPPKKPFAYTVFGGTLPLRRGEVNNVYRTLDSLWQLDESHKIPVSVSFVSVFRMGLRLLAESAAEDCGVELKDYLKENFSEAKSLLVEKFESNDIRGYLHGNSVDEANIVSLFHMGAHGKTSSDNREQAIALSLVLGAMLLISHGKQS